MGALEELAVSLLGQDAQKEIAAENPYYQFAAVPQTFAQAALSAQGDGKNPRAEMWNKAIAASLGGLVGGGLQGLGNDYQNTLTDRYQRALGMSLLGGRPSPEGLPPGLFGSATRGGALFNAMRRAKQIETADAASANVEMQRELLKLEKPWLFGQGGNVAAAMPPANTETPLETALTTGKGSTKDRYNELFQANLMQGQPPAQAAVAAREILKGELKANTGSYDKAAAAREYAQGLMELADRAESGIQAAGETGPGDAVRAAKLWTGSLLGGEESNARYTGRQILDSIKSDLVKMKRSPGAVSDYENRMILAGGPTTTKTNEANAELISNWRELARYNQDYADFLETYRETNGTIAGAETLWSEYRKAFPLYKETLGEDGTRGVVSGERPDWREFFVNMASGGQVATETSTRSAGAPSVGSMFNGQKVVSVKKVK